MDLYNVQEQDARLTAARAAAVAGFNPYQLMQNNVYPPPARAASFPFPNSQLSFYPTTPIFPPGTVDPRATSSPTSFSFSMQSESPYNQSTQFWQPSPGFGGDHFPVSPQYLPLTQMTTISPSFLEQHFAQDPEPSESTNDNQASMKASKSRPNSSDLTNIIKTESQ